MINPLVEEARAWAEAKDSPHTRDLLTRLADRVEELEGIVSLASTVVWARRNPYQCNFAKHLDSLAEALSTQPETKQ